MKADTTSKPTSSSKRTMGDLNCDWKALCKVAQQFVDSEKKKQGCTVSGDNTNDSNNLLIRRFLPLFPSVKHQINLFLDCLADTNRDDTTFLSEMRTTTRHALIFIRLCLLPQWNSSGETAPNSPLYAAQVAAMQCEIHLDLVKLLLCSNADIKCRSDASKALCNLVTTNSITSESLLRDTAANNCSSWLQMISIAAASTSIQNRNILAQIVATLHNCIAALEKKTSTNNCAAIMYHPPVDAVHFCKQIVTDKLLLYSLVLNILPAPLVGNERGSSLLEPKDEDDALLHTTSITAPKSEADSATEWILSLLIGKLVIQYDLLPSIYRSIGCNNDGGDTITTSTFEQILFLNFLVFFWQGCHDGFYCYYPYHRCWKSSLHFLNIQTIQLGRSTLSLRNDEGEKADTAACIHMLQVVASAVVTVGHANNSDDADAAVAMRLFLGQETTLVNDICIEIASIVDKVTDANQGKRIREMQMSNYHQTLIKLYVQVIANVSYRCKVVQDLLRQIVIEPARTGLHIIMSCTSVSHACVGLREWAIVAMRNLLEENSENQKVLEMLTPQAVANSDALESLGFGIDLNSDGHVHVVPPQSNTTPN